MYSVYRRTIVSDCVGLRVVITYNYTAGSSQSDVINSVNETLPRVHNNERQYNSSIIDCRSFASHWRPVRAGSSRLLVGGRINPLKGALCYDLLGVL